MRVVTPQKFIALPAAILFISSLCFICEGMAQNVVVLVNDEPITSYEVSQRQRWLVRTNGFGDRMKAVLTGDAIKERFRQMMVAANPRSQAEAEQVAEKIKKQLVDDAKRNVLAEGNATSRKAAIDGLVEDRLKSQAAKKLDVKVTDKEVEDTLAQRIGATADDKKTKLAEFYQQYENDGINRKTILEIIRVQIVWRDVIRKEYGPRIASLLAAIPTTEEKPADSELIFDVRVLRLAVDNTADQKAISHRMLEAENLKEKFTSCAKLPKEAKLVADATVKAVEKAKLASFPKDVQPLLVKASEGQMTPPMMVGGAVEAYAVCRKALPVKQAAPGEQKPDARQQEYDRFSRRYLQEIKQSASIDYRGS
jgi:peptidyl-prolyl cis-trans isomerase SurA